MPRIHPRLGQPSCGARYRSMKSARFSTILRECGAPQLHLLLADPAGDRALQAAIKARRVMTVIQTPAGSRADSGIVGFEPGANRQFLVFPKSLREFEGARVVGIQYDSIVPGATDHRPPAARKQRSISRASAPARKASRKKPAPPASAANVVPFESPGRRGEEDDADEALAALRQVVRRALAALENDKPVAAYRLLQRGLGE